MIYLMARVGTEGNLIRVRFGQMKPIAVPKGLFGSITLHTCNGNLYCITTFVMFGWI